MISDLLECDIDHYLVVAKVRQRLSASKQAAQNLMWRDLISGSYMMWKSKSSTKFKSQTDFQLWKTWMMMMTTTMWTPIGIVKILERI
jgi:hypothetical protein